MSESDPVHLPLQLKPCCNSLRHKMMYVDDRQSVRGFVDDSSDTRIYFCVKSQESLGPDGIPVHPSDCTPKRPCYNRES
ncbi:MAG: hypothetical protein SGJ09_04395 [Phycisphaerae bacterium]|nr:hypothetical protein [Phycisphaerae bacterium]MDZ4829424.1 hypothetical protein [Phycisphaerae bacterium]